MTRLLFALGVGIAAMIGCQDSTSSTQSQVMSCYSNNGGLSCVKTSSWRDTSPRAIVGDTKMHRFVCADVDSDGDGKPDFDDRKADGDDDRDDGDHDHDHEGDCGCPCGGGGGSGSGSGSGSGMGSGSGSGIGVAAGGVSNDDGDDDDDGIPNKVDCGHMKH